ncbi:uncharacterized protein LY89DRAFT_718256 [Mollisia scopiformis]|uniref:Uncharacterized protein n=1 Tax=Mollisia scopiformis TaxID=149040 RepID=A0A194XBP6_MOLSC|nr:uncharacterized protein LY89DRAFT_718256 [Mollisia scopiformis]KUJ17586.1 hypothetical protein LY89DRAFT_718256 [Mollisia scopiformis]
MDPITITATVVGLASKLVISIKQICEFWTSIEDAPEYFMSIARDLRLLQSILEGIEEVDDTTIVRLVLEECSERLEKLHTIVAQLETGFLSSKGRVRKWTALKAVFRSDQIRKIQESLSHTKQSLILAMQMSQTRQIRAQPQAVLDKLTSFFMQQKLVAESVTEVSLCDSSIDSPSASQDSKEIRDLNQDYESPNPRHSECRTKSSISWRSSSKEGVSRWRTPFGRIDLRQETSSLMNGTETIETRTHYKFVVRPSSWLVKVGLQWEIQASLSGRSSMLETFRVIPWKSPVFEYCRTGDIENLQRLISNNEASIWDVDNSGRTTLHYAARGCQANTCRFLINAGVRTTKNAGNFTPLTESIYGASYGSRKNCPEDQVETQRLLMSQNDDYVGEMMTFLSSFYATARIQQSSRDAYLFPAILQSSMVLQSELQGFVEEPSEIYTPRAKVVRQIWKSWQSWDTPGIPNYCVDTYDEIVDLALVELQYPSVFHACVLTGHLNISALIQSGANPHLISKGHRHFYGPDKGREDRWDAARRIYLKTFDTPTSLAMYTSGHFSNWRAALHSAKLDLDDFIQHELRPGLDINGRKMPLRVSGWTKTNLAQLFKYKLQPSTCKSACSCRYTRADFKQPKWLRFLWNVKHQGSTSRTCNSYEDDEQRGHNQDSPDMEVEDQASPRIFQDLDPGDGTLSPFCFPDHKGCCYVCQRCWYNNRERDFWLARDTSPDEHLENMKAVWEREDSDDSPFLLSLG